MAKSHLTTLWLLATALLGGCTSQPEPESSSPQATSERYVELRGMMTLASASRVFIPCNTDLHFSVAPDSELDERYQQLTDGQEKPVYAELDARFTPSPEAGRSYAAQLQPQQLYHMANDPAACARPPQQPQGSLAYGTGPSWSLSLSAAGASYKDHAGLRQWRQLQSTGSGDNRLYRFGDDAGNEVATLMLHRQACLDHQAERFEQWRAELRFKSSPSERLPAGAGHDWYSSLAAAPMIRRQGCAQVFRDIPDEGWSGTYRNQILAQDGSYTELRLHPDYSAEMRLFFPHNERSRKELGVWQPLDDGRLQVLFNGQPHHQADTVITFEVSGDTLISRSQQIDGTTLNFGGDPLALRRHINPYPAGESLRELPPIRLAARAERDIRLHRILKQYFLDHRSPLTDSRYSYVKYDLNQDGFDDALVMFNGCEQEDACTLTLFQGGTDDGYRFFSRLADIRTPLQLGRKQHYGWQDLLVNIAPEDAEPAWRKLSFNGIAYPYQPDSGAPVPLGSEAAGVVLFAEPIGGQWEHALAD